MSAEVGGGEDGCARAFPSVGGVAGVVRTERGRVGVGRDRVELLRLAAETRDRHAEAKTLLDEEGCVVLDRFGQGTAEGDGAPAAAERPRAPPSDAGSFLRRPVAHRAS